MKNKKNIIIIFIVSLIVMLPLFIDNYSIGHDTSFHISNIVSLTEQMENNLFFPSKIVGNIANNFGYGTDLFYPPLPHHFIAIINLVVNDISISMKISHFIVLLLSGLTMYFTSKKISKNDTVGLLSSIIYMLLPYHLSDIYIRDALGECYLFIFLPLIVSSLYELFNGNSKQFYLLFVLGYVGGMLSHLTMMVYFTVLVLLFLIIFYKNTLKHLKEFIIASMLILFIASPFLITVLEHKLLGNYTVFIDGVMNQKIAHSGLWPYQFFNFASSFNTSKIKYCFDFVMIIMMIVTIFNYKKIKLNYKYIIIFGLISILLSTFYFPWDILPNSARIIQFPWRMVIFVCLFSSLFIPLCFKIIKNKWISYIAILLMVVYSLFNINVSNTKFHEVNYDLGMGYEKEYLPSNTYYNINYFNNRNNEIIVKNGDGNVIKINDGVPKLVFKVDGNVTVELPRIYYIGYVLTDGTNNYKIYENNYGFIESELNSGTYTLNYTGTPIEKVCTVLSLFGIIVLIIIVRRGYEKN